LSHIFINFIEDLILCFQSYFKKYRLQDILSINFSVQQLQVKVFLFHKQPIKHFLHFVSSLNSAKSNKMFVEPYQFFCIYQRARSNLF